LDDVEADGIHSGKTADKSQSFVTVQPADFGRSRSRSEGWIHTINVEGYVHFSTSALHHLRCNPADAVFADFVDRHPADALILLKLEILFAVQRPANADLDHARRVYKTFLDGSAKRCSMKVLAPEVFVPGIRMRVEMDQAERPMNFGQCAQ